MKSIRELYRVGKGPSSSHTMAPFRAATRFLERIPDAASYRVTLYGSLAATGKGHLTDKALAEAFGGRPLEVAWTPQGELGELPNGMKFEALDEAGRAVQVLEEHSTGGGSLLSDVAESSETYPEESLSEILTSCDDTGESFWEFAERREGEGFDGFLGTVWDAMKRSVERGLNTEGRLPGRLGLSRKARSFLRKSKMLGPAIRRDALLAAYAYAVSEENASGGEIVTAPTCGASGVMPGVLYYFEKALHCDRTDILRAVATAGVFGNVIKENASISGSVVGCQGEVGSACAMAAAAATQLMGGSPRQIEYAAEMGLEHHLGLTCDPVGGMVQIPCIERNAHAAARAVSCCHFALLSDGLHRISFDDAVQVLLETGRALPSLYRETSAGGLAKIYEKRIMEKSG